MLFMTGIMGTRLLIPIISTQLGASVAHIGFIVSIFSLLSLIFAIPIGRWIDQYGIRTPLLISAFISFFSLLIPFLMTNLFGIYLSQIIGGLCQTVFVLSAQSYVGSSSNSIKREHNIAIFSLGVAAGSFVGPLLGGALSDYIGYVEAFALLGFFCLASACFIPLLTFPPTKSEVEVRQDIELLRGNQTLELLKISNLRKAFLISSLVLLARDIYIAYFPLLAYQMGISATSIGVIVALHTGAGVLVRIFMSRLVVKFGKSEVIVFSIFVAGLLYILIPVTESIIWWGMLSFLLGIGLGIGQPLSISSTIYFSPKNRTGEALGLRLSFNRLTQVLAPVLFGGIAGLLSIASIFWIIGLLLMVGSPKTYINYKEAELTKKKYFN